THLEPTTSTWVSGEPARVFSRLQPRPSGVRETAHLFLRDPLARRSAWRALSANRNDAPDTPRPATATTPECAPDTPRPSATPAPRSASRCATRAPPAFRSPSRRARPTP